MKKILLVLTIPLLIGAAYIFFGEDKKEEKTPVIKQEIKQEEVTFVDIDFRYTTSTDGLDLPERMQGTLNLSGLASTEGLVLPRYISGDLRLNSVTSAEGLVLPKTIDGRLFLEELSSAEGLVLPTYISGDLFLTGLKSTEKLVLPEVIKGNVIFGRFISDEEVQKIEDKYPKINIIKL